MTQKALNVHKYLKNNDNPSYDDYCTKVKKQYKVSNAYFHTLKKKFEGSNVKSAPSKTTKTSKTAKTDLAAVARKFNKQYFNDALDLSEVSFRWTKPALRTLGVTHHHRHTGAIRVTINGALKSNDKEWHTTLIHELVHVWQAQTYGSMDHGASFKRKAKQIFAVDSAYSITRTRSITQTVIEIPNLRQYAVIKGDRVNFLKNIDRRTVSLLIGKGYNVLKNTGNPVPLRHSRNLRALLTAKYYYSTTILKEMTLEPAI
jgi:hypothetical protein